MELRWLTGEKVLWASERSGWNHLYLYDLNSDKPPQTVTSGQWNMRRIERLDENTGRLWFFAVGIVDGQNPYHEHFCGVALDGSGLKVLTEGDGMHSIEWSPDRRWFLDRYSRTDLPPVTELRTADGRLVTHLESADATEVIQERGRLPAYPYLKPGDPIPQTIPRLFRMADRAEIKLDNSLFPNPWSLDFQRWSDSSRLPTQAFWLSKSMAWAQPGAPKHSMMSAGRT